MPQKAEIFVVLTILATSLQQGIACFYIYMTCAVFQQSGSFANILSTCNSTIEFSPNIYCTGEHYLSSDLESKAH